jgi:hypothetical protein
MISDSSACLLLIGGYLNFLILTRLVQVQNPQNEKG